MQPELSLSGPVALPKSQQSPDSVVLLLHGLGADGDDLFGLVPYFQDALPRTCFIAPNAPFACDMSPFGLQWFSLVDRSKEAILAGAKKARVILDGYIDEVLKKFNVKPERLVLLGFSQGGMLSLYAGLRRKQCIAGILSYSGALIAPQSLKVELVSKPPVCLVHGEDDSVVPFEAFNEALKALQNNQLEVQGYSRENLGHGIDPAGVKIGIEFLTSILNS